MKANSILRYKNKLASDRNVYNGTICIEELRHKRYRITNSGRRIKIRIEPKKSIIIELKEPETPIYLSTDFEETQREFNRKFGGWDI